MLSPRQPIHPAPYALALRGLRPTPSGSALDAPDSWNVIGGHAANSVPSFVGGATVSGGGAALEPNSATASLATVGGGGNNAASGGASTIAGGVNNAAGGDTIEIDAIQDESVDLGLMGSAFGGVTGDLTLVGTTADAAHAEETHVMKPEPDSVEQIAMTLYIQALKRLPDDIKARVLDAARQRASTFAQPVPSQTSHPWPKRGRGLGTRCPRSARMRNTWFQAKPPKATTTWT